MSLEGGASCEWKEGTIYDGNPLIMGIWADSFGAGAVLNMLLFNTGALNLVTLRFQVFGAVFFLVSLMSRFNWWINKLHTCQANHPPWPFSLKQRVRGRAEE